MNRNKLALARSRMYTLLSRLYLEGLTLDLLPLVQAIEEFAAVLPTPFAPDKMAAEHQALFGLNVFAYESFFLDGTGMLGGEATAQVLHDYAQVGYRANSSTPSPDHIGEELGLLAFLCGAEADAWEDDQLSIARQIQSKQIAFLQQHLLRWLLPCIQTIERQPYPFFRILATLTLEFVYAHYIDVGTTHAQPIQWSLPEAPENLLQETKTDLKTIAEYLALPAHSGLFWSRDRLGQFGQKQRLPRGFGNRAQMLVNLLRSAVQYEQLPAFIAIMQEDSTDWINQYRAYAAQIPELIQFIEPWQRRAEQTHQLLEAVKQESVRLAE